MEEQFVPYELAIKLKELGFDEECCSYFTIYGNFSGDISNPRKYNSEFEKSGSYISAPLWQQAFDWFLKEYDFWQYTFPNIHNKDWCFHIQWYKESFGWGESHIQNGFKTYQEARQACLEKLIELCKKN